MNMLNDVPTSLVDQLASEASRRRNLGIYYTPRHAAALLAKWAIRRADETVLEPSFGGCALLTAAVERLTELGSHAPAAQLRGYDVDPEAFVHLQGLLNDAKSRGNFTLSDFLKVSPSGRAADVVLANPPFASYRQMSTDQRESVQEWRKQYNGGFSMEAALWLYFLAHSLRFLREGGRIAFVLPRSYLASNYAAPVRSRLERLFRSVRVVEVNERLFRSSGAQERTCLVLADDYAPLGWESPSKAVHVACETLERDYLWANPAELRTDQQAVRQAAQALIDRLGGERSIRPLGDFFRPLIGEVTGDIPFFVKSLTEWQELGIAQSELTAILHGSSGAQRMLVRADDPVATYLLTPSSEEAPAVAKYLAMYPKELLSKNRTFAKRNPWWRVSCCTTSAGFVPSLHNGYFRLLINDTAIACTNSVYRLGLGGHSADKFAIGLGAMTSLAQLSAELLSRKLGGGALKLEPSDVARISLPSSLLKVDSRLARDHLESVDRLVRQGRQADAQLEADRVLLVESKLISASDCESLRMRLSELRKMRRNPSKGRAIQVGARD